MDWHRLFGLLLTDLFTGSPYTVGIERDLSAQQQKLDVLILRQGPGRLTQRLPDGLGDLVEHNLVTFKSHQEPLDDWALKELLGHYVAYRKLTSPSPADLLPAEQFRLYAVCSRFPHNLAAAVELVPAAPGVYHCRFGTDVIRIVVVRQLAQEPHNAPLFLFSGSAEQVAYGARHYRRQSEWTSALLNQLLTRYQGEDLPVYTMEDFKRDYIKENFQRLTPEEQAQALQRLPAEHLLAVLQQLLPEQLLEGLSAEEVERLLKKRKPKQPSRPRKPRRKQ
ncbi:MAG TPA: hypothetical protein VJ739_14370 [Gemmataceae bacterium]|nr:hypothetical protein [Gemmataceae bacterium]